MAALFAVHREPDFSFIGVINRNSPAKSLLSLILKFKVNIYTCLKEKSLIHKDVNKASLPDKWGLYSVDRVLSPANTTLSTQHCVAAVHHLLEAHLRGRITLRTLFMEQFW